MQARSRLTSGPTRKLTVTLLSWCMDLRYIKHVISPFDEGSTYEKSVIFQAVYIDPYVALAFPFGFHYYPRHIYRASCARTTQ